MQDEVSNLVEALNCIFLEVTSLLPPCYYRSRRQDPSEKSGRQVTQEHDTIKRLCTHAHTCKENASQKLSILSCPCQLEERVKCNKSGLFLVDDVILKTVQDFLVVCVCVVVAQSCPTLL